jgi:glycogen debranching enzyme
LWYNAIKFCLELAEEANDISFVKKWAQYPEKIKKAFKDTFWDAEKGYLADVSDNGQQDWSIRPNQIFAVSLPHSPIDIAAQKSIIEKVKTELSF